MSITIKLFVAVVLFLLLLLVLRTIHGNRIKLKHSIPWVVLIILAMILLIFWDKYVSLVESIGVLSVSDFTFFVIIVLQMLLLFYVWTKASIATDNNKYSIQSDALIEKRVRELEKKFNDENNNKD